MKNKPDWLLGIESLKIILPVMAVAIAYGVMLDQITIRVCPEYFTVARAPIFRSDSPILMAFGWGLKDMWWDGLAAGILFALAARAGFPEKLTWRRFVRPALVLLLIVAASALLAGVAGYWMSSAGEIPSVQAWGLMLSVVEQRAFMADVFAHAISYLVGGAGSVIIALAVAWQRYAAYP
jgi:hypothetical protein